MENFVARKTRNTGNAAYLDCCSTPVVRSRKKLLLQVAPRDWFNPTLGIIRRLSSTPTETPADGNKAFVREISPMPARSGRQQECAGNMVT